jgi:hypothetical protein
MKLLPPAGPERRRLFVLVALLAIVGVYAYYNYFRVDTVSSIPTQRTQATSNPVDALLKSTPPRTGTRGALPGATDSQMPQALRLEELENRVPEEPEAGGRNLFRFGVPPPPPAPKMTPVPPPPPIQTPPPGPPPIPPVPLRYYSYTKYPDGKDVAWLIDKNNRLLSGVAGDIVDGQYRLIKVTPQFVEMSYRDGSGRTTIRIGS